MITAGQFRKWMQVFKVLTGSNRPVDTAYASQVATVVASDHPTVIDVINTLYPIYATANFVPVASVNFVNEIVSINSRATPVFRYTGDATQQIAVAWNVFVQSTVGTRQDLFLRLCVKKADATIVVTDFFAPAVVTNIVDVVEASVVGQVELETGDSVFMQIENTTSTANIFIYTYTAAASSILAGIINTGGQGTVTSVNGVEPDVGGNIALTSNNIPQGSQNIYASNDGGTTDNLATLPTVTALTTTVSGKMAKSANLSDVASRPTAQGNLGLTGKPISVTASTVLTNPLPTIINSAMVLTDQAITLPAMNASNSAAYSQPILIICETGSQPVIVKFAGGSNIVIIQPGNAIQLVLNDNSTADGVFESRGAVFTVNEKTRYVVLTGVDIQTAYSATGYTPTSTTLDGQFEGISNRFNTFANDSNGVTIASQSGSTGATVVNSQASRNGNIVTLTGKIQFTATNPTPLIIITPPFGAAFTASNQASGMASITKTTIPAIGDGTVPIIDSVSGQGIEFSSIVAVGSGSYDLYFSVQYTIAN